MSVKCPTCESEHDSDKGMKIHHARSHGRKLPNITQCNACSVHIRIKNGYERKYCSECRYTEFGKKMSGENNPLYKEGEQRICKWCGDEFKNLPHRDRIFCGEGCYSEWQSVNRNGENHPRWAGRVETECSNCGKEKQIPPYKNEKYENHFCNESCRDEWRIGRFVGPDNPNWESVEVECEYCDESTWREPWEVERHNNLFCNNDCYYNWRSENIVGENHPNWKGGPADYGTNWHEMRDKVRDRDEICQVCGTDEILLHVHHRTPIREFEIPEEGNTMDNLILLCESCHMGIHRSDIETVEEFAEINPNGVRQ